MLKKTFFTLLVIFVLLGSGGCLHAGSLTFDGTIRERFEFLDGMNKKTYGDSSIDSEGDKHGDAHDRLLLQRIIAGFIYEHNEYIKFNLHIYDARVWGWSLDQNDFVKNRGTSDEFVMDCYEEYLELFDAYIEVKNFFIKGLSSRIGRQNIWYGDRRIFGPGGWGNSIGWIWDAVRFSYKQGKNYIDLWYGQTKTKDPESFSVTHKHTFQGAGLYSHYKVGNDGAVEPFFAWKNNLFHDVMPEEKTFYMGCRFYEKDFYGLNWDITYVTEFGDIGDNSVKAYGYVTKIGYRFRRMLWKPNIVLGRVFASGDNDPSDGTIKTFTRPFGSTDGMHYGRMDIISWGNMVDNQINLYLDPFKNCHLKIAFHNFSLNRAEDRWCYYKVKNKDGNKYKHLGDEIDFQLKWDCSEQLQFQVIYAYFNAGNFVSNNVAHNDAQRFFFQAIYKFKISCF